MSESRQIEIQVYRGADTSLSFVALDADLDPINLTGFTLTLAAKSNPEAATADITLTSGAGDIVIDADQTTNTGQFVVTFAAADTVELSYGEYQYAIWATDTGDLTYPVVLRSRLFIENGILY